MKKLLALVLSVVMVLGMGFSAFALSDVAGTTYEDAINYFVEHGIINGYEDGTFKPEGTLTRAEMTKILVCALGYEEEANALKGDTKFTDVSPKADWASGYINLAVDKGIITGVTDSTFAPSEPVTTGQLVAMVLRALGVEFEQTEGADWYVGAMAKAAELKLVAADADGAAPAARGLTMDIMFNSLDVKMADGSTLRVKIEGVDTSVLDVVSATATNRVEVDVVFNTAVDATTVEADNFELEHKDGGAPAVTKAEVLEDGKTVRLTVDSNLLTNQETYTVKVSDVKSAAGKDLQNASATFSVQDFTAPEATAVRFVGPNAVEVTFSEPVKGTGEVNIDNGAYMGSATADGSRTVTVSFGRNISAGAHEVRVSDFKDAADFSMINKTFNVDYQPVTVPVTATVKAIDQKSFTLEFSQPVSIDVAKDKDYFYHTYTGWTATQLQDEEGNPLTNGYYSVVKASFEATKSDDTERFIPVGTATVGVLANDSMKDRWGNKVNGTLKLTANVTADTTAPTVTSVKASDENTIKITFSEKVLNADLTTVSNYTVKNSKGEEVYFYLNAADDDKSVSLKFNDKLTGEYTVDVKGIKDASVSENEMAPYSATVNVSDMTAIESVVVTYTVNDNGKTNTIYVKYNEAPATTGSYSALDKNNYVVEVGGKTLKADDYTLNLYSDRIVRIVLDKAVDDPTTIKLAVGRIADVAGNVPTNFKLRDPEVLTVEKGPALANTEVKFVDGRTLVFTLSDTLQSVNTNEVKAYDQVTDSETKYVGVSGISYENKDGKAEVTVTLTQNQGFAEAMKDVNKVTNPADLEGLGVSIQFGKGAFRGSTGAQSEKIDVVFDGEGKATLVDKMAPEVNKVEREGKKVADVTVGLNHNVKIVYTEAIKDSSVYVGTYTVSGRTVDTVDVQGDTVYLTLKAVNNLTTNNTVTVAQTGTVQDVAGNEYKTSDTWTVKYVETVEIPAA